eukprot:CAMPEP_0116880170 /NCGR_PEP_ID=MMETSP0463-20121206/12068_1 /TAXON_ID=181622 /ORGANISM="Strombidinopsis sp, Strain SopsisLIS2011" /LENGTH=116 /DNA_ID=CAMNT_0004530419 /DNA_START=202 /DNA_END=552 /DNA_ORIENTATION=+
MANVLIILAIIGLPSILNLFAKNPDVYDHTSTLKGKQLPNKFGLSSSVFPLNDKVNIVNEDNKLNIYDKAENKMIEIIPNSDKIMQISMAETYACICLESKVVLVDINKLTLVKEF